MANIKKHLENIKGALFGKDVRSSIHDGIDAINKEVEGTTEKQNKLGEQFKNLVINEGNSNAEVAASRGSHDWLPDRLDNFDSQLEQNENQIMSSKAINLLGINKRFLKDKYGFYSINFIGDSITQGYNSSDHFYKSYMSLLRMALQNEYNTTNIGFVNVHPTGFYQELTTTGNWTNSQNYNYLGNQVLESSDLTGIVTIKPKFKQKYFAICYEQNIVNGSFDVVVNGVVKATIDSSGDLNYCKKSIDIEVDTLDKNIIIEIKKKDAKPISISGLWYFDDVNKVMINNYARSGATLSDMSNHVLDSMCDCNILFMALNHNDSNSRVEEYRNKINYVRDKVKVNDIFMMLLDYKWSESSGAIKNEMIRVFNELKLLNKSVLYYDIAKEMYQNDLSVIKKYGFLAESDNSHPTDLGMSILARGICKILNINPNFEMKTLKYDDWVYVGNTIEFENNWVNSFENHTRFKKINDVVYLEFYVKEGVVGQRVFKLPPGYRPLFTFRKVTTIFEENGVLKYHRVEVGMDGSVLITSNASYVGHVYGVISFVASN